MCEKLRAQLKSCHDGRLESDKQRPPMNVQSFSVSSRKSKMPKQNKKPCRLSNHSMTSRRHHWHMEPVPEDLIVCNQPLRALNQQTLHQADINHHKQRRKTLQTQTLSQAESHADPLKAFEDVVRRTVPGISEASLRTIVQAHLGRPQAGTRLQTRCHQYKPCPS